MVRNYNAPGGFTPFQKIVAIWVAVGAVIVLALLFAPRREPPPSPSTISYSDRPDDRTAQSRRTGVFGRGAAHTDLSLEDVEHGETEEQRYVFFGIVREADSGRPIKDAHVRSALAERFQEDDGDEPETSASGTQPPRRVRPGARRSTRTNVQGQYALPALGPGRYSLEVVRSGFVPHRELIEFPEGTASEVRFDVSLSRGASISGRITETGSNRGIPLIVVHASSNTATPNAEAESVSDGNYEISGLVPGSYQVSIDLAGQPYRAPGQIPVRNVVIESPEQEVGGIDFALSAAGIVWGYITDHDQSPVTNAQVYLCTSDSLITQVVDAAVQRTPPLNNRSENDGYYELVGVPLDTEWRVYADSQDYAPQLTDPFILTESARSVRVDIHIMPGTNVYGRVIDQDGRPVPQAETACLPTYSKLFQRLNEAPAVRQTRTDNDGSFVIANLPPGDYQVMAQKDGYKTILMGDPLYADGFRDIHGFDVVLSAAHTGRYVVYGAVMDASGRPIGDANITLTGLGTESMSATDLNTRTDARGEFGFYGVESGFLMLTAQKEGYSTKQVNDVRMDEPTNIVMEASGAVQGTVLVRETGRPPERYSVRAIPLASEGEGARLALLSSSDPREGRSFSNPDGSFELPLAAGAYTIEASAQGLTPARQDVTVTEGQRVHGLTLYVSQAGGVIEGQVQTAYGRIPPGATAWVSGTGEPQSGRLVDMVARTQRQGVQVGSDGRFEFRNLADGAYTVFAQAEGYAQGSSGPVQVSQGRTVSGVVVTLGAGGRLQGYVARGGSYLPGAIVTVTGNGVSEMSSADQNGQYLIDGLAEGTYRAVAVSLEGGPSDLFAPMHAQVHIREGETTVHNFGEEGGGATVQGVCSPPPADGLMGFAVLRVPGTSGGMEGMNLTDPTQWFGGQDMGGGASVIGMASIRSDGSFQIENCPDGEYQLDIMYVNIGEAMSGTGRPRTTQNVRVRGSETVDLNISVPGP